jgi:hypothetical protein
MVQGRLFRISGTVVDSQGRPAARTDLQLTTRVQGGGSSFGASTDEQGQFRMRNIPPGTYRAIARQSRQEMGPRRPEQPYDPGEMASVPVTVAGDVENLVIAMGPGATITGHLVFEQGPPSPIPPQMRIMSVIDNDEDSPGTPSPPPATVMPDLTFTIKGLMGPFLLRTIVPNQYLKSITVNTVDITDTPHQFRTNDHVVLTVTSRTSTLEGTVSDPSGTVPVGAGVVVFSEDKALWRTSSTRTRRGGVDSTGRFRVTGLMPGRYFVAAAPLARLSIPSFAAGTEFFEELSKQATTVVLGEDEQRRMELSLIGDH